MKDLVIIGGGPAAVTAAIYASRQKTDFRIITESLGGQAALSSRVENYTGFQVMAGSELISRFLKHAKEFNIEIKDGMRVLKIEDAGDSFRVHTADGECCEARALIIASGSSPRRLGVPGESGLVGRGLAYCAVCDAPMFSGKTVAVIGGGNSALDAARQLREIAKKVYIVTINKKLGGARVLREKLEKADNVEIIEEALTKAVTGEEFVSGLVIEKDGRETELEAEGVFVEIGWQPSTEFIEFVEKNGRGEIIIDLETRTSREGVYAAGDVTNISRKQIIIAAGAGAVAALNAVEYLSLKEERKND